MTTAPPAEWARIAALSQLPSQGIATAPLFAGYLFDEVSLPAAFELGAFFQLLNALTFGWLFRSASPVFRDQRKPAATPGASRHGRRSASRNTTGSDPHEIPPPCGT